MIRAQKTLLTRIQGPPTIRGGNQGAGVRHLRGHADTEAIIRRLNDVKTPAMGAAIVGRLLGAKTMTGPVTVIVITAAAGPDDVIVDERRPRRHRGRVHQYGGTGPLLGGMEEMGTLEIAGEIIDGDETF